MLRLLMMNENLQIVEVALTVVAPGTCQELVDFGVLSLLLFSHDDGGRCGGVAWLLSW